jgi:hypothetical protein
MILQLKDATSDQKIATIKLLNVLLRILNYQNNYRVHDRDGIAIRESTTFPPSPSTSVRFKATLKALGIGVSSSNITVIDLFRTPRQVFQHLVQSMDDKLLDVLVRATIKKPDDVDELTWSRVPEDVASRWPRFSPALQHHLIESVKADLASKFAELSDGDVGMTFLSPIGLTPPALPVRLPVDVAVDDRHAEVNKVYDLSELLSLEKISADGLRRNPITRKPFSLGDILPAEDALRALQERSAKALEEGAAPAGAGGASAAAPRLG